MAYAPKITNADVDEHRETTGIQNSIGNMANQHE